MQYNLLDPSRRSPSLSSISALDSFGHHVENGKSARKSSSKSARKSSSKSARKSLSKSALKSSSKSAHKSSSNAAQKLCVFFGGGGCGGLNFEGQILGKEVKFLGSIFRGVIFWGGQNIFFLGGGQKIRGVKKFGGGGGQICAQYSIFMRKFVVLKSFLSFWNLSGSIKRLWHHYITVQIRGCEEMNMMMMMENQGKMTIKASCRPRYASSR